MLFHLLVISIYKISTEAIEKLLLLSLQFLLKNRQRKNSDYIQTSKLGKILQGQLREHWEKSLPMSYVDTHCNMLSLIQHIQQTANTPLFVKSMYLKW